MPQGSIVGPLGFIIYVNDIPNSAPDLSFILFADDTLRHCSLNNIMNNGITKIHGLSQISFLLTLRKLIICYLGPNIKPIKFKMTSNLP